MAALNSGTAQTRRRSQLLRAAVRSTDTLPTSSAGSSGQFLKPMGAGTLTWRWPVAAQRPARRDSIQFSSANAFAASPNPFRDNANGRLGVGTTSPAGPRTYRGGAASSGNGTGIVINCCSQASGVEGQAAALQLRLVLARTRILEVWSDLLQGPVEDPAPRVVGSIYHGCQRHERFERRQHHDHASRELREVAEEFLAPRGSELRVPPHSWMFRWHRQSPSSTGSGHQSYSSNGRRKRRNWVHRIDPVWRRLRVTSAGYSRLFREPRWQCDGNRVYWDWHRPLPRPFLVL